MQFYGDLTFLGVYLLGLFFIPSWRKKKRTRLVAVDVWLDCLYVLLICFIFRNHSWHSLLFNSHCFLACLRSSTSKKKAFTEWNII